MELPTRVSSWLQSHARLSIGQAPVCGLYLPNKPQHPVFPTQAHSGPWCSPLQALEPPVWHSRSSTLWARHLELPVRWVGVCRGLEIARFSRAEAGVASCRRPKPSPTPRALLPAKVSFGLVSYYTGSLLGPILLVAASLLGAGGLVLAYPNRAPSDGPPVDAAPDLLHEHPHV